MKTEYWKIKSLQEIFDIEEKPKERTTVTESYLEVLKSKIRLMKEAQEFGKEETLKEIDEKVRMLKDEIGELYCLAEIDIELQNKLWLIINKIFYPKEMKDEN